MKVEDVRRHFLEFVSAHEHTVIDRAPLVLRDDPTTLFTGSGMQPLIKYLIGEPHPSGTTLTDVQPCVRAQDIDDVGDNRHTTFFEMLGNWSLGAYFKREQIEMFWRFLTEVVGLDPNRIYVSVYSGDPDIGVPRDEETADIWTELFTQAGVSADRVDLITEEHGNDVGNQGARIAFYRDKNWWSRSGSAAQMPIGDPGGPDSEVFYFFPQVEHDTRFGPYSHQNSDGGQYLEIGNQVFMEFAKTENGFARLPKHNVDFGGGLERIAAASIDSPDVYKVSTLAPLIECIEGFTGLTYDENTEAMRVIADHLRGAVFLIADGVFPASKEHGYVLRRLLRRAIRFAHILDGPEGAINSVAGVVIDVFSDAYPELAEKREQITTVIAKEERSFRRSMSKGLREVRHLKKENRPLTGADLFILSDRYGFPVELSAEEVTRQGAELDADWRAEFDALIAEQRQRSQAASKLGVGN